MMSDGALSQDEIDALLAGVDSSALSGLGGGLGGSSPAATMTAPMGASAQGSSFNNSALEQFYASTTGALSANLSVLTGASVTLLGPQVASSSRDNFLSQLPEMVTVISANYTSGFPGEHIFIFSEQTAKSIASLMTKEDNISLDEMAMSVIGEVISQIVSTQITSLTDKTGNKSIVAAPSSAANMPKAAAALPAGEFAVMSYNLDLGNGQSHQMWEILGIAPATDISNGLSGSSMGMGMSGMSMPGMPTQGMPMQGISMPGMQQPNMGMNMQGMSIPGMPMGGGMQGMNMQGMNMPGMGMPNLGNANVQPVQFPNLMQPRLGAHEAGNIGLIMDVSMEMTVELGRTRKLIKEILGMGEGTIIELDKLAGEPVDILVNHKLIAKGEVVVIDENFGVRVTEIVSPMERINDMRYN